MKTLFGTIAQNFPQKTIYTLKNHRLEFKAISTDYIQEFQQQVEFHQDVLFNQTHFIVKWAIKRTYSIHLAKNKLLLEVVIQRKFEHATDIHLGKGFKARYLNIIWSPNQRLQVRQARPFSKIFNQATKVIKKTQQSACGQLCLQTIQRLNSYSQILIFGWLKRKHQTGSIARVKQKTKNYHDALMIRKLQRI